MYVFCGKRMVLVIMCSALVLTACGNGEIEEYDSYHQIEENPVKSEAVTDIANTVTDEKSETESNSDKDKITENDWYTQDLWYRGTMNPQNIIHVKADQYTSGEYYICSAFTMICPFYPDSAKEVTAETLGEGIQYTYDDENYFISLRYFPKTNQVELVMTGSPYTGTKYDFGDLYEYDVDLTENSHRISNSTPEFEVNDSTVKEQFKNHFFDGQNFECFETNSGEDMILTIYLFYDSDENGNMISDIPSMYKGVLTNGMEFWFEPYEISQNSETYIINCDDGSAAYLEYITNMSEINLLAESGMLYDYGGTYIGLPDSEE